jgi:hypothetical protein
MSATITRSMEAESGSGVFRTSRYEAPWARVQQWISLLVILMLGYGAWMVGGVVPEGMGRQAAVAAFVVVLSAGLLSVVRGYAVTDREVVVRRLFWCTRLPLAGLLEVQADPALTRGSLRLFGNGGFLSTTGIFWNRRLGRYRMLANDLSRAVLLRYADHRVVVAPAHPERFAQEVSRRAGLPV